MKFKRKGIIFVICFVFTLAVFSVQASANECLSGKSYTDEIGINLYQDRSNSIFNVSLLSESEEKNTESLTYIVEKTGEYYSAVSNGLTVKNTSLSSLIASIEEDGLKIELRDIYTAEPISFTKSVTLCGAVTLENSNLNLSGKETNLEGFSFLGENSSLRVKDGYVRAISGKIETYGTSAVVVDFLSGACFASYGMEISAETISGAIVCEIGSVELYGGKVSNEYGPAIENFGSLWLLGNTEISGLNFDVITDKAVYLSRGEYAFSSGVEVMYKKTFDDGSFSVVFHGAKENMAEKISLYDATGERIPLKYFEATEYAEEKNILCVYLPYSVKFYSGSSLYTTAYFLSGETVPIPEPAKREGYSFTGWYKDAGLSLPYVFGTAESAGFSLYAGFKLTSPEFSISSLEFIYDAKTRLFGFDYLYHPLSGEGQFSFVWYKNNVAIQDSSSSIPITNVKDSGEYFCKLTFSYCGDFVSVTTPKVKIDVQKKVIEKPAVQSVMYNGKAQSFYLEEGLPFEAEPLSVTDAGTYQVTLRLIDFDNFKWSECESREATVEFIVLRASNEFTEQPSCENIYEGQAPRVKFKLKFGTGVIEYSKDGEAWTSEVPTLHGDYFLRVSEAGNENYTEAVSNTVEFTVYEELCTGIKVDKYPDKTDYIAFEKIDLSGAEFTVSYNSGRSEKIDILELSVAYKNGDCFLASDTSATVTYKGNSVPIPVKIFLAEYDVSSIVFEDLTAVYNGLRHTPEVVCNVVGNDGIPLGIKISGGGIDAGVYEITLTFISDSINYKLPDPITKKLTVTPLSIPVQYTNTEFIYDGTPKLPTAVIIGAQGLPLSLTVTGAATDVGTYTATATLSDKNYIPLNTSVEFKILKADFDLSGVYWTNEKFVYNGECHSVSVFGLPKGITLIGYANSSFTDAGNYIAEAAVSYDEKNYNNPGKITYEWSIEKGDYDLSGFSFCDSEYVFDGSCHYPNFTGAMPIGFDGISLSYSFSEGVKHVSEGKRAVTVTFESKSKNYNIPSLLTFYVTIVPKPISVEWENLVFVYSGTPHLPKASSPECEISVTGTGVDAGKYTAYAEPKSSDYKIINAEVEFTVSKAENSFTTAFSVNDVYFGDVPSVFAKAFAGEVNYVYYKDASLTEIAELPLAVGEYYAIAEVPESKNYYAICSEALKFSVIAILPTELKIEFNEPLIAMKDLSEFGFNAYFLNNNGSTTPLSREELTVEYQNGNLLTVFDKKLVVSAGGFSVELEISVSKNTVEIPKISPVTYDGSMKIPEALYSPLYTSDFTGAKSAGEYKIVFTLTDPQNYEFKGGINEATFLILKAPITLEVKKNGSDYTVKEGTVFAGDRLYEEYYESDGKIFIRIGNPNYDLTVIPRESRNVYGYVILMFVIVLVIFLSALALYLVFSRLEKRSFASVSENMEELRGEIPSGENVRANESATAEQIPLETLMAVDEIYADNLISDSVAKSLITEDEAVVETVGKRRCILNLDTISENFSAGETVNINDFKEKGIIPKDAKYVKVLARGVIDKPIHILANSFSLTAVKMIALTGGTAKRVRTVKQKQI